MDKVHSTLDTTSAHRYHLIRPDSSGASGLAIAQRQEIAPGNIALDANKTMEKFDVDGNQAPKLNSRTNNKEQP